MNMCNHRVKDNITKQYHCHAIFYPKPKCSLVNAIFCVLQIKLRKFNFR